MADLTDEQIDQLIEQYPDGIPESALSGLATPAPPSEEPGMLEQLGNYGRQFGSALVDPANIFQTGTEAVKGAVDFAGRAIPKIGQYAIDGMMGTGDPVSAQLGPIGGAMTAIPRGLWDTYAENKTPSEIARDVAVAGTTTASAALGPVGAVAAPAVGVATNKAFQYFFPGQIPATTPEQDAGAVAFGTVAAGAPMAVGQLNASVARGMNSNSRTATQLGATAGMKNPHLADGMVAKDAVGVLREQPWFQRDVMSQPDWDTAYKSVKRNHAQVGQQIGDTYATTTHLQPSSKFFDRAATTIEAAIKHPDLALLRQEAAPGGNTIAARADRMRNTIQQMDGTLADIAARNYGDLPVKDLWEMRKSIDSDLLQVSPGSGAYDTYLTYHRVLSDLITDGLSGTPQGKLLGENLNPTYAATKTMLPVAGSGVAKWDGQTFFNDRNPANPAGTIGRITGLGTNKGRAFAYRNQGMFDDIASGIYSSPMVASGLLPRNTDQLTNDPMLIAKVGALAVQQGLIANPRDYVRLSKPVQEFLLADLRGMAPEAFEQVPGNYNSVMDGKFADMGERDMHVQQAYDKKLSVPERAQIIGGALSERKYVPLTPAPTPQMIPAPMEDYSPADLAMALDGAGSYAFNPENTGDGDLVEMLRQRTTSQDQIDVSRSGL